MPSAVALAAIVLAVVCTGVAGAMTASPAGEIAKSSLGPLRISEEAGFTVVECAVTLRGRFNSSIVNRAGSQVYALSSGRVESCAGGTLALLFETAWSATLNEAARLERRPRLMNMTVSGVALSITVLEGLLTCLFKGTITFELEYEESIGETYATGLLWIAGSHLPKFSGGGFCPSEVRLSGPRVLLPTQVLRL